MSSIPAFGPANVSAVPPLASAVLAEELTAPSSSGRLGAPARDPRQPALSAEATAMLLAEQNKLPASAPSKLGVDPSGWDVRKEVLNFLDLRGADFRGGTLVAINLSGLNGVGIDLSGADPCDATLGRALLAAISGRSADLVIASIRDAGLDRANFTGADSIDATVEPFYVRASAGGAHDRGTASSHLAKGDLAGAVMIQLNLNGKAYANTVLDGVRFVGAGFDRAGFASADLIRADLGLVRSAQLPGFALNNMLGLDLRGFDFTGQFRWFPAERRRRAARWRRRREPSSQRYRRFGFEDAFF